MKIINLFRIRINIFL